MEMETKRTGAEELILIERSRYDNLIKIEDRFNFIRELAENEVYKSNTEKTILAYSSLDTF